MDRADFIVVGGGTAGAVLASRLSQDPSCRVVLVEAGDDTPPGAEPADIRDVFPSSFFNRSYFWPGLEAGMKEGAPPRPFLQARVMGGGSSVMGMWALCGLSADYDGWAQAGARGWSWAEMRPYVGRINRAGDAAPGNAATPAAIRRLARDQWPAFARAMEQAAAARGLGFVDDINAEPVDGFFAMPLFQDGGVRVSSARCYLDAAVRRRGNLIILPRTRVLALVREGRTVVGVEVLQEGARWRIAARETILSAGAIHSPTLLLRAGIGPAPALAQLGIEPVADRPGVGRNLQNHVFVHFALTLESDGGVPKGGRHYAVAGLRLSSAQPECPRGDLLLCAIGRVSPRPFGRRVGMLAAALYAPHSRGELRLVSPDASAPPSISFRLLSDARDRVRLVAAGRFAESLLLDPAVRRCYREAYLLPQDPPLRRFNDRGASGGVKSLAAAAVLAGPTAVRRWAIARAVAPGRLLADTRGHRPLAPAEILDAAAPMFHPAGTCAMGRADDPQAVVDPKCRVHGVANLRVVDASIMPRIPSANTNLPTLMVAERAAALIRGSA